MKGIKDAHRIVVKVGTSTLTYDTAGKGKRIWLHRFSL